MLLLSDSAAPSDAEALYALALEKNWLANLKENSLSKAFPRKQAVHAGMTGMLVEPKKIEEVLTRLRQRPRSGSSAAYVHLPYCESKCLYCGFFGGKYSQNAGSRYLKALLQEIEIEMQFRSTQDGPIHALYLGGGTPTALQANELQHLLETLRGNLPLANDCEITVEGRVFNFTTEKIEACLKGGANRFSLGVQTFNTDLRRMLGRFSSREEVIEHLQHLASYNEAAIVIDLIYGLPGQSIEDWKNDVRTVVELPLDGVDLYQLNVFPGSALQQHIAAGKIPAPTPLHEQGSYFLEGVDIMQQARFSRLSMSHWGRNSRERNLYNPLAKTRADCLHFGSGAAGALQGFFMANESKPDMYIERCLRNENLVAMMVSPPKEFKAVRMILEQMEQCRLNLNMLTGAYSESFWTGRSKCHAEQLFAPLLENWQQAQLIQRDGAWMELTLAGQFWQVNLTQALLGWQSLLSQESNHVATH